MTPGNITCAYTARAHRIQLTFPKQENRGFGRWNTGGSGGAGGHEKPTPTEKGQG